MHHLDTVQSFPLVCCNDLQILAKDQGDIAIYLLDLLLQELCRSLDSSGVEATKYGLNQTFA